MNRLATRCVRRPGRLPSKVAAQIAAADAVVAVPSASQRPVVPLDDPLAVDPTLVGAKAAALASAAGHGLPVLPGFVLTTAGVAADGGIRAGVEGDLRRAWGELSADGKRSLVVRSSSTVEDGASTSMAGMFTSVLDVRGWTSFLDAVATVLASTKAVPGIEMAPMAVLVQPFLNAKAGGVLFGADPVTGRTDRFVLAAVEGGPDQLVSGAVDGAHYVLSRRGGTLEAHHPLAILDRRRRRQLARLAASVAHAFGSAQDVEWAIDDEGTLRLLQSRPITAVSPEATATGPVFGPGPVAESFPDALSPLEVDLWLPPLRTALAEALLLTGSASRRQVAGSPVVVSVAGRLAADLELLGIAPAKRRFFARFDPRPPARRLRASWRVGRLRAALPALAADLVSDVDSQLLAVPDLDTVPDESLAALLRRSNQVLVALHGHEVLMGLLVSPETSATTGASVALQALAGERSKGTDDEEILASHPVVLALVAPKIQGATELPPSPDVPLPSSTAAADDADVDTVGSPDEADTAAELRETLRLRVRWVQELTARAAWTLGTRLAAAGRLGTPDAVRHLTIDELEAAVAGAALPGPAQSADDPAPAPLPAAFRLSESGEVVEVRSSDAEGTSGRGAGGGRSVGHVHDGSGGMAAAGSILVVRSLDPTLASTLPHLGGLVAETGSVLSHLAILAREFGVPTVVGVPDAVRRFPPGSKVLVDGASGEVQLLEPAGPSTADTDTDTDTDDAETVLESARGAA